MQVIYINGYHYNYISMLFLFKLKISITINCCGAYLPKKNRSLFAGSDFEMELYHLKLKSFFLLPGFFHWGYTG
jgi:hypothetical protein